MRKNAWVSPPLNWHNLSLDATHELGKHSRLPTLLRRAGFADVRLRLVHPVALVGGIKLLTCVTFDGIRDTVRRDGLATEAELNQIGSELQAFASDPETVHGGPRVFQAWARRF